MYQWLREHRDEAYFCFSTKSGGRADMVWRARPQHWWNKPPDWRQFFADSLWEALHSAVDYAGGVRTEPGAHKKAGPIQRAQEWFLSSFPLLRGVVAGHGGGLHAGRTAL